MMLGEGSEARIIMISSWIKLRNRNYSYKHLIWIRRETEMRKTNLEENNFDFSLDGTIGSVLFEQEVDMN